MKDDTKDVFELMFFVIVIGISIPVRLVMVTLATMYGWQWFVVPLGAPPIGVAHAVGLLILVMPFKRGQKSRKDKDPTEIASMIAVGAIIPAIGLFLMWLAHLWMGTQ